MPNPEEVNPHNFKVDHVLFAHDGFSVAWGTWEGDRKRLAMRWDGDGEDKGYPKTFGHPVWFIVADALALPFIGALLGRDGARGAAIALMIAEQRETAPNAAAR